MKAGELTPMWQRALVVMLLLILIALAANWALLIQLNDDIARLADDRPHRDTLPCAALPTLFVLEFPDCAQRLLDSMNVTSVRIGPSGVAHVSVGFQKP